jgi:peptidoglycan lytic transglycosylase G
MRDSPNRLSGVVRVKAAALLIVLALIALAGFYVQWSWRRPLDVGADVFVVKPGTSLRGLARQLNDQHIILEPYTFTWMGYLTGRSRHLKAGEYRFESGINAGELLDRIVAGRVIEYPLIFVEGWNYRQMMRAVQSAPKLAQTLPSPDARELMMRLGHPEMHPEGRFFPDTYHYSLGHTDLQVLARAFEKMQTLLKTEWDNRVADLPLRNIDEALVLASIVEKETGRSDERAAIAGVFVNRLRKGMKLQSDPTVIYGIGPTFDGNIRLRDLRQDTPYNTYTRTGLPPTPIAMPGRESIVAVLHPADTQALYFVSRGDGSHVFSKTLQEHTAAVIKYQLGGRAPGADNSGRR